MLLTRLIAMLIGTGCCAWTQSTEGLEKRIEAQRKLLWDWGGLNRYGSENSELPKLKPGEIRVVFLGDEITQNWGSDFFSGKPYLNRGIERQSSAQMLVRFQQDVIAIKPAVVVIQAGLNDLLSATQGVIADNYISMVQLAKFNGIKVVIASVTPASTYYAGKHAIPPQGKIIGLNGWIKDYAQSSGCIYLDYYSALATGRDFNKSLTDDGLLPNAAGYKVMAALSEKAIAEAVGNK